VVCAVFLAISLGLPKAGYPYIMEAYGQEEESRTVQESGRKRQPFYQRSSGPVIVGTKAPWLFFNANDGQPLQTYQRTNRFTDEELAEITGNIDTMRKEMEDAGISFVLMIAPDKEQIYGPEYMPPEIPVSPGPTRTEQLIDYMAEHAPDVCIVYPRDALNAAKQAFEGVDSLYYESDTHWNHVGAYVGARELIKAIAGQRDLTWEAEPKTFVRTDSHSGDLQRMAGLGKAYYSQEYIPVQIPQYETLRAIVSPGNEDIVWQNSESRNENRLPVSVYLTGDSFRWHMVFYLQEVFEKMVVTSRYYFDIEDVAVRQPQVFVYMIGERYLHELSILPGYNTMALQMPETP